jgi:hybrid cluster-associated redox disulfide protein
MKRCAPHRDAELTIETLLSTRPGAAEVLLRHGMACVGCAMARFETLAEAAREYRLDLSALVAELRLEGAADPRGKAAP